MQANYSEQYIRLWKNHWWWQSRHELVMRTIRKLHKQAQVKSNSFRILDIGCGGGVAFDDVSQFGDVYGIEPDPHLAVALPHWRDRIEWRLFDNDYVPQEPFNLVLMLDVLEHIQHDEDALLHLKNVLEPGGFAIITVPALEALWSAHDEVNLHYRRYTAANLKTLLTSCGFQVRKLHYYFSWSLPLMYLRKFFAQNTASYLVDVPRWPINGAFKTISNFENLLRRFQLSMPLGSSLFVIAENPR